VSNPSQRYRKMLFAAVVANAITIFAAVAAYGKWIDYWENRTIYEMTLEELLAHGPGQHKYIRVTDFVRPDTFYIGSDWEAKDMESYVALGPPKQETVKPVDESKWGELLGKPTALVVWKGGFRSKEQCAKFAQLDFPIQGKFGEKGKYWGATANTPAAFFGPYSLEIGNNPTPAWQMYSLLGILGSMQLVAFCFLAFAVSRFLLR
jgi:hypothetical protein